MFNKNHILTGLALPVAAACALLTGCATTSSTPPLYQWDAYQPQVHEFFKGQKSSTEQIDALEKARQQALGAGKAALPPGFHAHLGALYASVGNSSSAKQEFAAEKQSFPESSAYMDFLSSHLK
ncbi:putative lipoprotein [Candidatus Burkholderia humilis]|nr:putative lipoprotein [Candidatus Burkholderia humilis]